jgi:hypothetical protein
MQPEDIARMQKSGDVLAMPGKLTVQPTGPKRATTIQMLLLEQRSLFDSPMPHHDLQSCQLDRLNH